MKRFLLSLVLIFLSFSSLFAQRDTEHWIAPYYYSTSYTQALYLSTDSVTPFQVTIYSNNTPLPNGVVTISKNNPVVFPVPAGTVSTNSNSEAFNVINKGMYLNGAKPFYCTLRMVSSTTHAEILTSKGKAGIGNKFYVAGTPYDGSTDSLYNFTAGVLATENNTVVTVTWTGSISFYGGGVPPSNTKTFTLNKGQSFIFAGSGDGTSPFTGAKIVSNKPITLTNGNVNGNFGNNPSGSDAVLDQSVPVERLGSTFAMVRTRSTNDDLEGAIIVATEDNTQIFLNGSNIPAATKNEGEWFRVTGASYIQQGGASSNHYNMLVSTSKNAYVYQLVSVLNSNATCGFNYIPPLSCFLPKKIDEIPLINEMPLGTGSTSTVPSGVVIKLNILTEAGANVTVNGVAPTAAQGPFQLTGNTNWVTYGIEGVTGNLTIQSTKAVTAGINGGYSTSGYGGYFAGFSSIPIIAKQTGDCIPGIILEVDDSYDTYQWYLESTAIPGATSNTYTPTVAGNYTVKVTMGTCPPVTTPVYKVFKCLQQTNKTIYICGAKTITPTFTNSTQTLSPGSVTIITQPTKGTATINPSTGVITYMPNTGNTPGTQDVIVYKFCGTAPEFVDCEEVTLNLMLVPFVLTDRTVYACKYSGNGFFDLTSANVTDNTVPTTKKYYPTLADLNAGTNQITNPSNYFSAAGFVYVFVTTNEGCAGIAKITLDFYPTPVVKDASLTVCYIPNNETKGAFDLTSANVTSETPVTKKYYPTFTDASNGTNEITLNSTLYISANSTVYVRVFNSNNCYAIAKISLNVTPPNRSTVLKNKYICINDRTTLDAGPGYQSYLWSTGATTQTLPGVGVGEYWVTLQSNGCYVTQLVSVKKAEDPVITNIEISNNSATVLVNGGTAPYKYSLDGTNWQDSNVFTNLSRGQHKFFVKDSFNCAPISVELTVPNLVNVITPNGDKVNDYIDYKELAYKENLTFVVYDRYGNMVFKGDKFNNYKWDGTHQDKKILTGTYWYHINWNEPNAAKTPIKYSGWILVKNRE
ncbi:gliding motility-associated C-terminal domain-containing protein [Chryseobacterium sp. RR2-3-20]|uniref:T9SS type B sorting domain-containing protein n=1 Tax=Chryseobacterium sp. RR2-3-20 TaxID=2787626 RepID=UPI001ADF529A|nr:gliding motility-associated C-terminal domain-containing protein [Chryseobacterium sp. RR2-3-20]